MALNKYMHPRNRYMNAKPSFLDLALKYPSFRAQVTQDDTGKVLLDFKNADALRALSTCLLKEDFDLTVELPPDRLVPTLPLRLNYIHWIEDIVGQEPGKWGIDIGTGASCIYPLLATKMNGWNFLATESDAENIYHAKKNVEANQFTDAIHVLEVTNEDALSGPLEKFTVTKTFDFCMCNPPFFADIMEAQAIDTSRSVDRPDAGTVSTASPQECIAQGGEVGFVRQMIEESTVLRDKIRVYTSMVGKKSSLSQLKDELRHQKVPKFSTTEFCQGRTMRWGIAWSFDKTVTFPRSCFESRKEKPPLQFFVPKGAANVLYNVHAIAGYLKDLFRSMKIHCYQGKMAKSYSSITLTAVGNTWCHQRRMRRQQQRNKKSSESGGTEEGEASQQSDGKDRPQAPEKTGTDNSDPSSNMEKSSDDRAHVIGKETETGDVSLNSGNEMKCDSKKRLHSVTGSTDSTENTVTKKAKLDGSVSDDGQSDRKNSESKQLTQNNSGEPSDASSLSECSSGEAIIESPSKGGRSEETGTSKETQEKLSKDRKSEAQDGESPKEYILKCVMRLKRVDKQISLELEWLDGKSRELMHQVKTFLQNKLKVV